MSERKAIASIEVFSNEIEDDYDVVGFIRVGGVKIEIDTNMNRVRDFFTKRSTRQAQRTAQAEIYKNNPSKAVRGKDAVQ